MELELSVVTEKRERRCAPPRRCYSDVSSSTLLVMTYLYSILVGPRLLNYPCCGPAYCVEHFLRKCSHISLMLHKALVTRKIIRISNVWLTIRLIWSEILKRFIKEHSGWSGIYLNDSAFLISSSTRTETSHIIPGRHKVQKLICFTLVVEIKCLEFYWKSCYISSYDSRCAEWKRKCSFVDTFPLYSTDLHGSVSLVAYSADPHGGVSLVPARA